MMDRVSGWYKRRAQWFMLLYGFILAAMLNVDALELTGRLWKDPIARAAVVASASELAKQPIPDTQKIKEQLPDPQSLPIGWPTKWSDKWSDNRAKTLDEFLTQAKYFFLTQGNCFFLSLFGWFVTGLAASLGAPFWFDAIGKLVNLKGAGATPQRATEAREKEAAAPVAPAAATAVPLQEPADNRNAIIDLYAEQHKGDESYRPITVGERW
jgi:hypothetical protein